MNQLGYFVRKFLCSIAQSVVYLVVFVPSAFAAFGLSSSQDFYTVDTGSGLVFSVRRTDNGVSTQSAGDIASLTYNGVEYQNQQRGSQINSGFDWLYDATSSVSVNATTVSNNYIKVTVKAGDLTHYYMARNGYPNIYMGTYFTAEPDVHGQVRYIMRLNEGLLPYSPEPSDLRGTVSTVESSDIFALSNGETRSKHYSNNRLKDWQFFGASSGYVGMWMVRDNQEGGSGGPFYRSLLMQTGSDQELTYIVNYAQSQTEPYRTGVLNSYTFVVTDGSDPNTIIDTSWFNQMALLGYMAPADRGRVAGVGIANRDQNYAYTVGFANEKAQYWVDANPDSGGFSRDNMRPGSYTMTVYKNELAVASDTVTVNAGQTTILNTLTIADDPSDIAAVWRIGDWDGSPKEFLNGDNLTTMHPSDPRLANWDADNFIVGTSESSSFPAYMWKEINNDHVVYFRLSASEFNEDHTVRIGLTTAYANGRPRIAVNNWVSAITSGSTQSKTRSLTTGSYRGNNVTYSFNVPASAWKKNSTEWNELTITAISGSGLSGYLSAGFSVDSVDLLKNPNAVSSSSWSPSSSSSSSLSVSSSSSSSLSSRSISSSSSSSLILSSSSSNSSLSSSSSSSAAGGVQAMVTINNDWGSGYCASLSLTNTGSSAVSWNVVVPVAGTVISLWNGRWQQSGSALTVSGVSWNSVLAAGKSDSSVGFCAFR